MKVTAVACAALGCLTAIGAAAPARAFGTEDYIGSVGLFAGRFCPQGSLEADGRILSVAENTPLFTIYGTTYGGDGQAGFALPDLRGKIPVPGMRYCVTVDGYFPPQD